MSESSQAEPQDEAKDGGKEDGEEAVKVSEWQRQSRSRKRAFPASVQRQVPLRVTIDQQAYMAVHDHCRSDLEAEVCGVLLGDLCHDDHGSFDDVKAIIRGTQTGSGSRHVTYTHETWEAIHKEREEKHPKLAIVGWYHSHPGFGVQLSDMDAFIHQNFFPEPSHIALVVDPLGREDALAINQGGSLSYIPAMWVGSREKCCFAPGAEGASAPTAGVVGTSVGNVDLGSLVQRVNNALAALDEERQAHSRFLLFSVMLVLFMIGGFIIYQVYEGLYNKSTPPRVSSYVPVPIKVGDDEIMVGLGVVEWKIPEHLRVRPPEPPKAEGDETATAPVAAPQTNQGGAAAPSKPDAGKESQP